ncbi:MAG: FMN-binding negative transcriptional regulator [Rhodobacteraceae bacterium]|nr:FMN-binding negative transcriptional regulator [Paracoccaceae bacterium]
MHPNQMFHDASEADNLAFARERGFGVLAVGGKGMPMLAHVPFLVAEDSKSVELHLVRSNHIARMLATVNTGPLPALLAISGPDSYISPDWYGVEGQVPTWNYVAVHLSGLLERLPDEALRGVLDRLSMQFEAKLEPKAPWTADKMEPEALGKMMRMIVPFRMELTGVDGTWKLAQNKPDEVRERAAGFVDAYGIGSQERTLAALMRGVLDG